MAVLALIGLGSNLGDRRANLDSAVAILRAAPSSTLRAVSAYHETPPVGGPVGQPPFLNAAAAIETSLAPRALLAILQSIEAAAGRTREVSWGPRPIDLDLLLFGDAVIDGPGLVVPHLYLALRRFVLAPLAEIAPEAVDPLTGRTVRQLLQNLDRRPGLVALAGGLAGEPELLSALAAELPATIVATRRDVEAAEPSALAAGEGRLDLEPARSFLAQVAEPLSLERWAACPARDGWLITGAWLDEVFLKVEQRLDPASRSALREFFLHLRRETLQPTFAVVDAIQAAEPLTDWLRLSQADEPIGRDTPLLRVRGLDLPRLSALRNQSVSSDPDLRKQALERIEQFKAEAQTVIIEGIRNACSASRSTW